MKSEIGGCAYQWPPLSLLLCIDDLAVVPFRHTLKECEHLAINLQPILLCNPVLPDSYRLNTSFTQNSFTWSMGLRNLHGIMCI
jgi:hypothetical protein